jgi:hypothetical protein
MTNELAIRQNQEITGRHGGLTLPALIADAGDRADEGH